MPANLVHTTTGEHVEMNNRRKDTMQEEMHR